MFSAAIIGITVSLIIYLIVEGNITVNNSGDFCAYHTQIINLYSSLNLTLSLMLLIVAITNTVAYVLLISIVRKYFNDTHFAEERKQLTIVFSVFFGVVMTVMVASFISGSGDKIISKVTVLRGLENTFAFANNFPCIFVILYFHHINYRPVKLETVLDKSEPETEVIVA